MGLRIDLETAISDKILLKPWWDNMTKPQQVVIKSLYGLDLDEEEQLIFSMFQESCEIDELGYPTKVTRVPYIPKEYRELTLVAGRRWTKTSGIGSFVLAYEAVLGGHREYASRNQEVAFFNISQQLEIAKSNMNFVKDILQSTPFLEDQVEFFGIEKYTLKDGSVIAPSGPSLKRQRGLAVPCYLCDEEGFWSLDAEAANPDVEVERALSPTMLQFPHGKKLRLSSPYVRHGVFYDYYNAGTEGNKLHSTSVEKPKYADCLMVWATTAMSGLKLYTRKDLARERAKDPFNFEREYLARFVDSISGFFNAALVDHAFSRGKGQRERVNISRVGGGFKYNYIAAIDPAFKRDSFALAIVHRDENQDIVLDYIRRWSPAANTKLDPGEIMTYIANICQLYDIKVVYTDQHQFEALDYIAAERGIGLQRTTYDNKGKNKIYGSLLQVVNQRKLVLLDDDLNEDAKALRREMLQIERKLRSNGSVAIEAPANQHDDLVQVLALASHYAVSLVPQQLTQKAAPPRLEVDHVKMVLKQERNAKKVKHDLIYG